VPQLYKIVQLHKVISWYKKQTDMYNLLRRQSRKPYTSADTNTSKSITTDLAMYFLLRNYRNSFLIHVSMHGVEQNGMVGKSLCRCQILWRLPM